MNRAHYIGSKTANRGMLCVVVTCLSACLLPDIPYDGNPRTTFIFENDRREFTALVFPRTAPEPVVVEAVLDEAHPFCAENFDTTKVELITLQPGTLSAPSQWEVRGRCV